MTPKIAKKPASRLREATALLDSPQITAMFEKVRTAAAPAAPDALPTTPQSTWRGSRFAATAIVAVIGITWWCSGGSHSPCMRLTLPGGTQSANVIAGQTSLYNGDFFYNEHLASLGKIDLLKGNRGTLAARSALDDPHIGYAVFGNLFTVGLSAPYALWVFSLVLYALCAWLVTRASDALFHDRTKSTLAASLFVLSIAATVHVGDLSPRLLAIAFCYLWILLLLRLELEDRSLTGPLLLGLSTLLGAWSLVSTTSAFGLAILAVFLFKRRSFLAVGLPALAWIALPQLQHVLFTHLSSLSTGPDANLAWQGLERHWLNLAADPLGYACFLALEAVNFLLNDNPLDVLIGFVGLIMLRHRAKWLLWTCLLAPIAVSLTTLPTTTARGCAVAGNTIVLFAIVSHFAVEVSRRLGGRFGPKSAFVPLLFLLTVQAVWSHSIVAGWRFPAGSYATGFFENVGLLQPTDFVRVTGPLDDTPTVAGGIVSASVSYGLLDDFGRQPVVPVKRLAPYAEQWSGLQSLLTTLKLQAPFLGCLLIAAFALMRLRTSLLTTFFLVVWFGAAQLCGAAIGLDHHVLRPFDERIAVKEDEKLVVHLRLSDEFRELLERAARDNRQVEFALQLRGRNRDMVRPAEIQVDEWASDAPRFAVDAPGFLEALKAHRGRVELAISPKAGSRGLLVHSWQALGNSEGAMEIGPSIGGREAIIVHADGSTELLEWFPTFEIRVIRGENSYAFKTVLERFESSRPAGYVLIGF